MSLWGTIDARFVGGTRAQIEQGLPTGSENGPTVSESDDGEIYVHGDLRDVDDSDSPAVLAWFVEASRHKVTFATLRWELGNGPRYRYEWRDGELVKLRGVLD